jgi:general secretion pathway protein N
MSAALRTRLIFFLGAFAAALLATLPLRLALAGGGLAESGLAAREARGSLWWGSLEDVRWGPVPLGDFDAGLRPLQLLLGQVGMSLDDRGVRGTRGRVFATSSGAGISDADAFVPVGTLLAPLPVSAFELEKVSVHFGVQGCSEASGLVRARVAGSVAGLVLPPTLGGAPRCEGGSLLLPLSSPSGAETIEVRIAANGRYEAAVIVRPREAAIGQALAGAGFRRTSRGYLTTVRGSLANPR